MDSASNTSQPLMEEHRALMRQYGRTQSRCSDLIERQAAEIEILRAQSMRLRGAVVVRETALSWAREERSALEASIPGLRRRVVLARRIDRLVERVQELMRERLRWQWRRPANSPSPSIGCETAAVVAASEAMPGALEASECAVDDAAAFEASLVAADLVICQTGCLSHDAYWRVQDHCKRTGKACVVVARPDILRIVRIHESDQGGDASGRASKLHAGTATAPGRPESVPIVSLGR